MRRIAGARAAMRVEFETDMMCSCEAATGVRADMWISMELERHAVGRRQPGPERVIQETGERVPDVHGRSVRAERARLEPDLSGGQSTHAGWWAQ